MPSINYTRPFVYEYQRKIIDAPERFTVTEASTKVGKSASHLIWLFEQPIALNLSAGKSVWWVAPVYAQAEIMFNRLRNQITDRSFLTFNQSKLTATYPTGAIIAFKSAEKPDNLYGDDVYAAVFDEFTRAREQSWHALRSTLTATIGKCKFIGNVKGRKNWGYRLAQRAKAGEPDHAYFKITAYDAAVEGLLSFDEIAAAKRDLPDAVFKELYLAEAAEDASNPFGLQHIRTCVKPISTLPAVCFGIDLAKSVDWTVIVGLDVNGDVCYFDRFQLPWNQTLGKIRSLPKVPKGIDSTGVGDPIVEELQTTDPYVQGFKFNSFSKQQLMEGYAVGIHQRRVGLLAGVMQDEHENFEYEYTRTGVRYTAPEGLHDDTVCAGALAYDQYKQVGSNTLSYI